MMVNATDYPGHFEAFKAGSRTALRYYCNLYGAEVFQLLDKKIEDEEVAKTLTSKVFTISYEKREKFGTETQLRPCLFNTAERLAQAYFWDKGKIKKIEIGLLFTLDEGCSIFDDAEIKKVEVLTGLFESMMKLSPRRREIVIDACVLKRTTREIAHRLRITPQTVLNHKSQALNILKQDLWGKWGENNPFLV
jgi:DNA-directed RNA polymerase specialized sigma24 family protein